MVLVAAEEEEEGSSMAWLIVVFYFYLFCRHRVCGCLLCVCVVFFVGNKVALSSDLIVSGKCGV